MELYNYQKNIIQEISKNLTNGIVRQLITLATGGGKTIVAADLINTFSASYKFTLFVVHRTSLIQQTLDKFAAIGLIVSGCSGNHKPNVLSSCVVATWQSLKFTGQPRKGLIQKLDERWIFRFNSTQYKLIDVIILDEAHLTAFTNKLQDLIPKRRQFVKWSEGWMNPKKDYWNYEENSNLTDNSLTVIGLTATPWRLNCREFLSDYFDAQILGATVRELQIEKRLSSAEYKTIKPPVPLKNLKVRAGDYVEAELERAYCTPAALEKFVESYLEHAAERQSIIFCSTCDHARAVVDILVKAEVTTELVIAATTYRDRQDIFEKFSRRQINCLVSVSALCEGFDSPVADCIVLCRPTKSRALAVQMVGRGLRYRPDKQSCLVLDFAGILHNFGAVEDMEKEAYSMRPAKTKLVRNKPAEIDERNPQLCPNCDEAIGYKIWTCPHCGCNLKSAEELAGLPSLENYIPVSLQGQAGHFQELIREAFKKGYHPLSVDLVFQTLYPNQLPSSQWYYGAIPKDKAVKYWEYLNKTMFQQSKAIAIFCKVFGVSKLKFQCSELGKSLNNMIDFRVVQERVKIEYTLLDELFDICNERNINRERLVNIVQYQFLRSSIRMLTLDEIKSLTDCLKTRTDINFSC